MDFVNILIFTLIPKAILTLSIYFYDKSRGIEKKAMSYVLAFIFGLLYIIGRLITKKGTRTAVPDKKFKKISIVLLVVYILYVIGTNAASYISISNAEHYYDMKGNGYNRWYKVVYYTEDGTGYVIDRDEYMFVEVDAPENKIDT